MHLTSFSVAFIYIRVLEGGSWEGVLMKGSVRWVPNLKEIICYFKLQCRGVLLIWITVGEGPAALAVGAGGGCSDIFFLSFTISLSPAF